MKKDNVVSLKKPGENSDTLTELLRDGARTLLAEAVQAELAEFLSQYQAVRDARGRSVWYELFRFCCNFVDP